ncbi:MAG: S8 family serine peptidase [Phycisphaerae bacterium]|nr:S8 family serine peptidase [Phycisphaerae bacterium]
MDGPLTKTQRETLARNGVRLVEYLPDNTYVARLGAGRTAQAAALDFVRSASELPASRRLAPGIGSVSFTTPHRRELAARGFEHLIVVLLEGTDPSVVSQKMAARGAEVVLAHRVAGRDLLEVRMPAGRAADLAALEGVRYVEEAPEATLRNNTNAWIVQSNMVVGGVGQTPVWANGLHGEGQIGGLIDGPFKLDHCDFEDPLFPDAGPDHRKVVSYYGTPGTNSHGTHTAGTFVGDAPPYGTADTYDGIAYAARIAFTDYYTVFVNPSLTYAGFETAHNDGARVHSNSWGDDGFTDYTLRCQQIDQFMWDYEDDLIVFATTNTVSLQSPENAKNLLAVGASQDTPLQDYFCRGGTGPTLDGRRKPEIFAPGCGTYSASSGTSCGVRTATGTSMACPVIAGAGLLARQYYTEGFYPTGSPVTEDAFVPSGALLKATLLNAAVDMTGIAGYPSDQEGWGRLRLDQALHFAGDASSLFVYDRRNAEGLSTGDDVHLALDVVDDAVPLRVTLAWTDYPAALGANPAAVNNLDLLVTGPDCTEYKGNVFAGGASVSGGAFDTLNNVEQVHLTLPATGTYGLIVRATAVNQATQGFALVVSGVITGTESDCNTNGVPDACDVDSGRSLDINGNGRPDECDLLGDFDEDGDLDEDDYAILLQSFGLALGDPEYNPACDLDGDDRVTLADYQLWLALYRVFLGNSSLPAPGPILGDADGDGDVDVADYLAFAACLSGPGQPCPPGDCPGVIPPGPDLDRDADVDLADFATLQIVFAP